MHSLSPFESLLSRSLPSYLAAQLHVQQGQKAQHHVESAIVFTAVMPLALLPTFWKALRSLYR